MAWIHLHNDIIVIARRFAFVSVDQSLELRETKQKVWPRTVYSTIRLFLVHFRALVSDGTFHQDSFSWRKYYSRRLTPSQSSSSSTSASDCSSEKWSDECYTLITHSSRDFTKLCSNICISAELQKYLVIKWINILTGIWCISVCMCVHVNDTKFQISNYLNHSIIKNLA